MKAKLSMFEADVRIVSPLLGPIPIALRVVVPAGLNAKWRAQVCARVTAAAMMGARGGVG